MVGNTIDVEISLDGKKYNAQLKKLEGNSQKKGAAIGDSMGKGLSSSFGGVVKNGLGVALGIGLARLPGLISGLFSESISAANRQEDAINSLNAALKRSGDFSAATSKDLQDFASSIQKVSIFGDEAVIEQLAFAKALGLTTEQAKMTVKAATELSAATNGAVSFDSAVRNIAKTFSGLKGELGELLPSIRNLTAQELRSGEAAKRILAESFGAAAAQAQTARGAFTQLSNSFGDLTEKIGSLFTKSDIAVNSLKGMSSAVNALNKAMTAEKDLPMIGQLARLQDRLKTLKSEVKVDSASGFIKSFFFSKSDIEEKKKEISDVILKIKELQQERFAISKQSPTTSAPLLPTFTPQEINARMQALMGIGQTEEEVRAAQLQRQTDLLQKAFDDRIISEQEFNQRRLELMNNFNAAEDQAKAARAETEAAARDTRMNALLDEQLTTENFSQNMSAAIEQMAKSTVMSARKMSAALVNGIGNSAGAGFAAFGKAIVSGQNALESFGKAFLSAFGNILIQQGTGFILMGVAEALAGIGSGAALIASGAAMATFGGALSAVSAGSPSTPQAGSATASNATTIASPSSSIDTTAAATQTQEQRPKVEVNIQGDVLDSSETSMRIVSLIEKAGFDSGARSFA